MSTIENMNIVIIGHVDHGKSTVVGRMLADTGSLPEGKLESIKAMCDRTSKVFEYAFLLDALENERDQGITIDMARCFFKSSKRHYILLDAPGHIEFLKNMITGASRAEAAVLVIDAKEGIRENSKRHGLLAAMLGIKQLIVCVNKMDLVDYSQSTFNLIVEEYTQYLRSLNVTPVTFIPVAALLGENIASKARKMEWYRGECLLTTLDNLEKEAPANEKAFRMHVQDVYKFTQQGDSRRIVAGRVDSGELKVGDSVIFYPSLKKTTVASIESFNSQKIEHARAGQSIGFTLAEQVYAKRGELVTVVGQEAPIVGKTFKANIFWMGKTPLEVGKNYYLKIGTEKVLATIKSVEHVIDSENHAKINKKLVERHEIASCIVETKKPIAFDLSFSNEHTSRFVIVDNYEIRGGGIIVESINDKLVSEREEVLKRELNFIRGRVAPDQRALRFAQKPTLILITGEDSQVYKSLSGELEEILFRNGRAVYYLGFGTLKHGLDNDIEQGSGKDVSEELVRRFAETIYLLLDAGLIVVASARNLSLDQVDKVSTIIGDYQLRLISIEKEIGYMNEISFSRKASNFEVISSAIEWLESNNCIFSFKD